MVGPSGMREVRTSLVELAEAPSSGEAGELSIKQKRAAALCGSSRGDVRSKWVKSAKTKKVEFEPVKYLANDFFF